MKYIILLLFLPFWVFGQKYFTKTGLTEFKASVKAFESVEAKNNSTTAILNAATGQVAVLIFVKAFHFKVALMEEHFNENYMDSDKFPKATFKGSLENFKLSDLGNEGKSYKVSGTLTVKGKNSSIETTAVLKLQNGSISVSSQFQVKPEDFDIKIPNIVREKISKIINIALNYELIKKD